MSTTKKMILLLGTKINNIEEVAKEIRASGSEAIPVRTSARAVNCIQFEMYHNKTPDITVVWSEAEKRLLTEMLASLRKEDVRQSDLRLLMVSDDRALSETDPEIDAIEEAGTRKLASFEDAKELAEAILSRHSFAGDPSTPAPLPKGRKKKTTKPVKPARKRRTSGR